MKENSKMNQIMASQMLKEAMAIGSTSKENVIETLEYIIKKVKEIDEKDYLALASAGQAMSETGHTLATASIKKYYIRKTEERR